MSELKTYFLSKNNGIEFQVYLKSEADKVIADLEAGLHQDENEIRRLKRALYKACANWALSTLAWLDCIDQGEPRKWSEMVQKCLKKAEEWG